MQRYGVPGMNTDTNVIFTAPSIQTTHKEQMQISVFEVNDMKWIESIF